MTHTRYPKSHAGFALAGGILAILLIAALSSLTGGCSDPRSEPLQPAGNGYTETKVLWDNVPTNGGVVDAAFTVDHELAPITDPLNDVPARLTVIASIIPDADILHREHIISAEIPPLGDQIVAYLVQLNQRQRRLDSLAHLDSLCSANPDSCALYDPPIDSTTYDAEITQLQADTAAYNDSVATLVADTTALGATRDSLAAVVDNRYTLTIWLDDDTTSTYPEAVFTSLTTPTLGGQGIYLAVTDTSNGYKSRRFEIDLNSFHGADPNRLGRFIELNWLCYPGTTPPCIGPGTPHTLRARVTGAESRITATLVLVYAEANP